MSITSESNPCLMTVIKNNCPNLECSLCYKAINKTFFQCSAPCNKIFHVNCMEQSLEQTADAAWEADVEPEHKCCYCRRHIDLDKYQLHLFARRLMVLRANKHDVSDALTHIRQQLITGIIDDDEDTEYSIYEIRDMSNHMKKPKQSKHAEYQKKMSAAKKPQQIRIKQNIGGRRR